MVMYENDEFHAINLILTNYRLVVIGKETSLALGIPWIMIASLEVLLNKLMKESYQLIVITQSKG